MFDLLANEEVDDISIVPAEFQPFYTVDTATKKAVLRKDDPLVSTSVKVISGLNQALKASRTEAGNYKTKAVDLAPLSSFGKTPAEIKAAIDAQIEELQGKLAGGQQAKIDIEKIKADLAAGNAKQLEQYQTKTKGLETQLDSLLVDQAARRALAGGDTGKPLTDDPELALPFIQQSVRVVEEDGRRQVYVVDAEGARRFNPATQLPMTVADLVAEMKTQSKYARLFSSEAPKGMQPPAARSGSRAPAQIVRPAGGEQTPNQKIAAGLGNIRR